MMKRHYVLKSCLGTGKTELEADVGAVQPGDCCRELLLNHPSKQHLHMCAADQKLWGWRGTRMVLGRKGKRLEQATSDGSGRDGVFWGHQAMLGRSCPLSKRWKLRLNSTRFEFPNGRAGNWQGAVHRAAAPPVTPHPTPHPTRWAAKPKEISRAFLLCWAADVCRMTPHVTARWNPGARQLLWSRRAGSGTHSPPKTSRPTASTAQPCTMAQGTASFQVQQLKEMILSRKETPLTSIRELICT